MRYELSLKNVKGKNIYPLGDDFKGISKTGEEISFTNYYMQKNGIPFFGISGEFHFSRMSDERWEDELIKMKMCGINVVSTYLFWIHHEEEEGIFDFSGRRNLRRFAELCAKHGLYVILRVGPFDHGEVRNGGLPDWLYGKPFEVRKISDGFLYYTRRWYSEVAKEVSGLFFKDNGPVIGVQIDNEYMHASAPWEITRGISDEWIFGGDEGDAYMLRLKELAAECGLTPAFYTCTGWGGAATPDSMLPLWGGYAFRPWIFRSYIGDHPVTEEYVYQDFHNNNVVCTNDFKPAYQPEERPYACCEMSGGMTCFSYYRFQFPFKSVDAMANIKIASGCNFLGYYMFHGGSNPVGRHGGFLNEGQAPKISYDFQAALGEFGQIRESYRRLKSIHYFVERFAKQLCGLQTVLPAGASLIEPRDMKTLRYAVRTDGKRGFLFVNNYQDHAQMPDRNSEQITLLPEDEELTYTIDIAGDENAILPFHLNMDGIDLIQATAQPITSIAPDDEKTYVFFVPGGMQARYVFEAGVTINGEAVSSYQCKTDMDAELCTIAKGTTTFKILTISRRLADQMFLISGDRLVFTQAALLEDENGIRLETTSASNEVLTYPADVFRKAGKAVELSGHKLSKIFGCFRFDTKKLQIVPMLAKTGPCRYTIEFPQKFMQGMKDARLQLDYSGDIGHAFIDGKMIHDNFCNGTVWEIGLKDCEDMLAKKPVTIYITPLKEGAKLNAESATAFCLEDAGKCIGELKDIRVEPVYEIRIFP